MKRVITIASLIAVIAVVAISYFKSNSFEVVLTAEQIQKQLDKKFPIEKSHLVFLTVTFQNPKVHLENGSDRIALSLEALLNLRLKGEKNLGGSAEVSTALRYNPEEHAFYLVEPVVERLDVQGIPEQFLSKVQQIASELAKKALEKHPVYRLKGTDTKQAVARMVLRDVHIEDSKLIITLGL